MNKNIIEEIKKYKDNISKEEIKALEEFFEKFEINCQIDPEEKNKIKKDFINAIIFYINNNYSIDEALKLLDIKNIGSFYCDNTQNIYELDDFAKITLAVNNSKFSYIFRIGIYLNKEIIPELLQLALTFTIDKYTLFGTRLKKIKNKYFFETCKKHYFIEKEDKFPCKAIDFKRKDSQLFRVLYFENKISLEVLHILTDGMGAIMFLKTLIAEYIKLREKNPIIENNSCNFNESINKEKIENAFDKISINNKKTHFENIKFLKIKGKILKNNQYKIINIKLDSTKLKNISKKYNTTITGYLTSVILLANKAATNYKRGYTNVYIPINLRTYYPTKTIRNFSTLCNIYAKNEEIDNFDSIIKKVKNQLQENLVPNKVMQFVINTKKVAKIAEKIPYNFNKIIAKINSKIIANYYWTNDLSNLGEIKFPDNISKYVISMEAFMNLSIIAKISCAVITVNNVTTFSIFKNTNDTTFEKALYEQFYNDNLI